MKASLETLPYWQNLKAIEEKKVYDFEYYGLINPGSLNSINTTFKLNKVRFKNLTLFSSKVVYFYSNVNLPKSERI